MCKKKLKPVYSYIIQKTHLCRQWLHFRILMRKIRLETTLAETSFPSTTWTLKRWALEENLEGINLSSRHKYDPQAHNQKVTNYNAMVRILFTTSDTLEHFFPYMIFLFVFLLSLKDTKYIVILTLESPHIYQKYFRRVLC